MPRITFSAKPKHEDIIDDAQEDHQLDSKAEAVRHCIEYYADSHHEIDELEDEIAELEDEIGELNEQIDEERAERRAIITYAMGHDPQRLEEAEHVEIDADDDQPPAGSSLSSRIRWLLFGDDEG